jgi:SAM-dependent methyltransferase
MMLSALHDRFVSRRRVNVLARHLSALIPPGARVLDVGCGDGAIDCIIMKQRPDVSIKGIDVLVRPASRIAVRHFDGAIIPYADASFDVVMFVDVLHHTQSPVALLTEAARVAHTILIKDHFREGFMADATLRFMDWVGNAHHGVALPYNYWRKAQWDTAFGKIGFVATTIQSSLDLYPVPARWIFDRGLHFVGRFDHASA